MARLDRAQGRRPRIERREGPEDLRDLAGRGPRPRRLAPGALRVYRGLVRDWPDPAVALDAAETLLDADFEAEAQAMAREALDLAEAADDERAIEEAKAFLLEGP